MPISLPVSSRTAPQCLLGAFFIATATALNASELPLGAAAGDMDISPFYRWQGETPARAGTLLKSETLPRQKHIRAASQVIRILYSSTDLRWKSGMLPVSGTLFLPATPAPAEGWPLLAWAHGTLGIADVCAPSWSGFKDRDAAYINRWLERGYAVVATDYQGLGGPGAHPYSFWPAEGASVLDSIRAARAVKPARLSSRALLAGQSQGGGAALGAALLADRYAPDIDILGAMITAPNSTFPEGPVKVPPRSSNTLFLSLATGGLSADAPALEALLSPKGMELLDSARRGCTQDIARRGAELNVASFKDLLAVTPEQLSAWRTPMTDMPLAAVAFPLLIATGEADRTIEPMRQYAVAAALCAAGNKVTWKRYEGMGHDGVLHASFADALDFADRRFAGKGYGSNCPAIQPPGAPGVRDQNAPFNED